MKNFKGAFRRVTAFVFACVLLITPVFGAYGDSCAAGEMPIPGSEAAYVVELTSGTVVYSNNANEKMFPASTTKLMTALLAIEHVKAGLGNLSDTIIFSSEAINGIPWDTMHINLSVGEKLTVEQTLYAILLPSANEACLGMAEYVAGDIPSFIAKMNTRAAELGMTNTHYVTANGLHDENHYTTAYDMSLLMQEVLKHEELVRVMSTASYVLPATNMSDPRTLTNTNKCIIPENEYYNPHVICGKTGFTTPAGNTLVTYSEVEDQRYITVLLKANQGITFSSTDKLMDYFAEHVRIARIENLIDFAVSVPVTGGGSVIMAQPAVSFSILTHVGDDINSYRKEYSLKESVDLPVYAGDAVGTLYLYDGENLVASVSMVSRANYGVAETTAGSSESVTNETDESGFEITSPPIASETTTAQSTTEITTVEPEVRYSSVGKTIVKVLVILLVCIVICVIGYGIVVCISIYQYNSKKKSRKNRKNNERDGK